MFIVLWYYFVVMECSKTFVVVTSDVLKKECSHIVFAMFLLYHHDCFFLQHFFAHVVIFYSQIAMIPLWFVMSNSFFFLEIFISLFRFEKMFDFKLLCATMMTILVLFYHVFFRYSMINVSFFLVCHIVCFYLTNVLQKRFCLGFVLYVLLIRIYDGILWW